MTINEIFETIRNWSTAKFQPKGNYASSSEIPTKVSELENDKGFISSITDNYVTLEELESKGYLTEESDPTVPEWAKKPAKPTYSKAEVGLGNADNTPDISKPVSTAQQEAIDAAYQQATAYADRIVNALVNGAPSTLDTLGEIAKAMQDNQDVVETLEASIGTKANQLELDSHVNNNTIHITSSERQKWNDGFNNMTAATASAAGKAGLVPAPEAGAQEKYLTGGATFENVDDHAAVFTSGDTTNSTGWTEIATVTPKEKYSSLWHKFSLAVKNLRYLWKLVGNTQISVGDGTMTGAINALNRDKAASNHTHSKSQIIDFPNALPASDVYSWAKAASKPAYNWNEINSKPSTFTPSSHTHDERYYTKNEINTKISGIIKIKVYTSTTTYSSPNVAMTVINHDLGARIISAVAAITDADCIRNFPYNIACAHSNSVIQIILYSYSLWNQSNSAIKVKAVVFYA